MPTKLPEASVYSKGLNTVSVAMTKCSASAPTAHRHRVMATTAAINFFITKSPFDLPG